MPPSAAIKKMMTDWIIRISSLLTPALSSMDLPPILKTAKKGTANVTATAENGAKLTVRVIASTAAVRPTAVRVSGPSVMKVGKMGNLSIKPTPAKATGLAVTFKSSNPKGLYVDKAGKLTALKKGSYNIMIKVGAVSVKKTVKIN